ncbi:MAG: Uncharacterised protein [Halieaceae bacterium]|nr:MAG: Uncharacterised protein [Halieaceae bacterium]
MTPSTKIPASSMWPSLRVSAGIAVVMEKLIDPSDSTSFRVTEAVKVPAPATPSSATYNTATPSSSVRAVPLSGTNRPNVVEAETTSCGAGRPSGFVTLTRKTPCWTGLISVIDWPCVSVIVTSIFAPCGSGAGTNGAGTNPAPLSLSPPPPPPHALSAIASKRANIGCCKEEIHP